MNRHVRFEDEADLEYREAGRWYETRQTGLGIEFFDAVDAAIQQIVNFPHAGAPVLRVPRELPARLMAETRFPYHVIYLETSAALGFSPLPTIDASLATGEAACDNFEPSLRQPNDRVSAAAGLGLHRPPSAANDRRPVHARQSFCETRSRPATRPS